MSTCLASYVRSLFTSRQNAPAEVVPNPWMVLPSKFQLWADVKLQVKATNVPVPVETSAHCTSRHTDSSLEPATKCAASAFGAWRKASADSAIEHREGDKRTITTSYRLGDKSSSLRH